MPLLGAHVRVTGGLHHAFERARAIGCDSLQIFVKSPSQWRAKALDDESTAAFHAEREAHGNPPVFAHAAYLINLCAADPDVLKKSRQALADELARCAALGIEGLIVHPGSHKGIGVRAGCELVGESLREVFERVESKTRLLLENTAGQGSALGAEFGQLATMLEQVQARQRLAVCLDTCHAFAAGYDLTGEDGLKAMLSEFDDAIGLGRLACLHLNDSKHPLASRKDRHANIGAGEIGAKAFARILKDKRLAELPMILETPLGDDGDGHKRDLERLRAL